jgi:hypothetical protein
MINLEEKKKSKILAEESLVKAKEIDKNKIPHRCGAYLPVMRGCDFWLMLPKGLKKKDIREIFKSKSFYKAE